MDTREQICLHTQHWENLHSLGGPDASTQHVNQSILSDDLVYG